MLLFESEIKSSVIGNRIRRNNYKFEKIKRFLNELKTEENISEEKAINLIKNISIAKSDVPLNIIDFHCLFDKALMYLSKFIKIYGSEDLKIMYALYKSQTNEEETFLYSKSTSKSLRIFIDGLCDCLLGEDKKFAEHYRNKFVELLKKL